MGPLLFLLLPSMLLSSLADAQGVFTIRNISLSIEPSANVSRGTNVTVRCAATVSSSGQEALSGEYTIYKETNRVYTKTFSTAEDFLYPLPEVRVSNTGKYKCQINIKGKKMTSDARSLTVTGLSKPRLELNRTVVDEGEEVTARCTAPGETGTIFFYFYDNSKVIQESAVNSNQLEATFELSSVGAHKIHCAYAVLIIPDSFKSKESNTVQIWVQELSITPVLEISPQSKIVEGDLLSISCTVRNDVYRADKKQVYLYLSQGTQLLSSGETSINTSVVALARDTEDYECRLEMGNLVKVVEKRVSVTELFSAPTLTVYPAEVFQREYMTLTCRSEHFAHERMVRQELTYTLEPPDLPLRATQPGVFSGVALPYDFNYTCVAKAKGVIKRSARLTVRSKESASVPVISVVGKAILGQPFRIRCKSATGSFPINYTLLMDGEQLDTTSVETPLREALFEVTVTRPDDISKYRCQARNNRKEAPLSKILNATIIEPLRDATLTVLPDLAEISEGEPLYLICGTKGTPPVTFRWFRVGDKQPLFTTTSDMNNTHYRVSKLSKEHGGTYYCEAVNRANNVVRSRKVVVEVHMALWKKALIGGVCLLVVSILVVACVLYFKSKRGAAPLYDGVEGRGTNGTRDSAASLPADISNRSSYSLPATV